MLDEVAIERFEVDGAVALRGLLDQSWIEALREAVPTLLEGSYDPTSRMTTGPARQDRASAVHQQSGMWRDSEPFRRFLFESPIAAASAELLRSSAVRLYEDLFQFREAGAGESGWHRDAPHWPVTGNQLTNVWFTLEAVTPYTGGIHIVAGSHRDSNERVRTLTEPGPSQHVLAFGTEPGDVVIFHPRALHSGYGAAPDQPRRTFTIRFMGDDVRWRPRPAYYHEWMRDCDLAEGDLLDHPGFPVAWPAALAPTANA